MQLKTFQVKAIEKLIESFYKLWNTQNHGLPITFKSPTGSGKTIMLSELLKRISGDVRFESDLCFVWISKGELSDQSKRKFTKYYNLGLNDTNLMDLSDLSVKEIGSKDILFLNWEKVVSKNKENRKVRKTGEANTTFDKFIENTINKRYIVAIVDESHLNLSSNLSQEIIKLLNPRIIFNVSATPKNIPSAEDCSENKAAFVKVSREEVVKDGLIKKSIALMPREELEKISGTSIDEKLIDLGIKKRNELKELYSSLQAPVNPLCLIQLPNDTKNNNDPKLDFVMTYLQKRGVDKKNISIWLSTKKFNLDKEEISLNDSAIDFLIFKQSIATGWDCPRASILVGYREMRDPIFKTQILGRILRMPEARHYSKDKLNKAYCYTNYSKKDTESFEDVIDFNNDSLFSYLRKDTAKFNNFISQFSLPSYHLRRTTFNDLGESYPKTFFEVANHYFNIKKSESIQECIKKLNTKNLETENLSVKKSLIVDANIEDFDNFINNLCDVEEIDFKLSYQDLRKLLDLLIYNELRIQNNGPIKFGGMARSFSKLKSALNLWLKQFIKTNPPLYEIICNDLLKDSNSSLRKIISISFEKYKPIRDSEIILKKENSEIENVFSFPEMEVLNGDHTVLKSKKSLMQPFAIKSNYRGKENEVNFINYLEKNTDVAFWYKNLDSGENAFSIPFSDDENKRRLFFPDFIVITKNSKICIFDTKKGETLNISDAKHKNEALINYAKSSEDILDYGLIANISGVWKKAIYKKKNDPEKFTDLKI